MILVGDVGGTNCRLALFEKEKCVEEKRFSSKKHPSLESVLLDFLKGRENPETAVFGVAGPVSNGICKTTNIPWEIHAKQVKSAVKAEKVYLINDLVANAYGIEMLEPKDFVVLNEGDKNPEGNRAIISAGTGLGQAGVFQKENAFHPFATEGGHTDFAARDELDFELFQFLQKRVGHVSYERIVSGPGILEIYRFLCQKRNHKSAPFDLSQPHIEKEISKAAVEKRDPLSIETMNLFCSLYGAEAGNLALKQLATGGLYLGGGIAPGVIDLLREGPFLQAFLDKGRFSSLLKRVPVKVIMNDRAALMGAFYYATQKQKTL